MQLVAGRVRVLEGSVGELNARLEKVETGPAAGDEEQAPAYNVFETLDV